MKIKELNLEEAKLLYDTKMKRDFPPSELRPFSSVSGLTKQGHYRCFGCMDGEEPAAYAFFAFTQGAALLDYLAVDEHRRGRGVGKFFLSGLRGMGEEMGAPYFLIEAESVESAVTPEQTEERVRRMRFYEHCGCRKTAVYSLLFGVEYRILYLPLKEVSPTDEEVKEKLHSLYRIIVPPLVGNDPKAYEKVCRCFLRPPARDFNREFGRALTFLYRGRNKFMGESLRDYGFSGAMYMILLHVGRHPGASQDSIATHMYIDKCNVARRTKKLEELGFLYRETDENDRRQNNLYLTEKGKALVPLVQEYLSQWVQAVTASLGLEEKDALLSLLTKMTVRDGG